MAEVTNYKYVKLIFKQLAINTMTSYIACCQCSALTNSQLASFLKHRHMFKCKLQPVMMTSPSDSSKKNSPCVWKHKIYHRKNSSIKVLHYLRQKKYGLHYYKCLTHILSTWVRVKYQHVWYIMHFGDGGPGGCDSSGHTQSAKIVTVWTIVRNSIFPHLWA